MTSQQSNGLRRMASVLAQLAPRAVAGAEPAFVSLEEAAKMSGVRVTQVPGVPGIYAECLKNLLDCKGVEYTRAIHPPIGKQDFLYQLTAQMSLPTLLYNDERPRNSWVEQVVLADQLGKGPSLIPRDPQERILMFGLMTELLAEDGIIWRKRVGFGKSPLTQKYGFSDQAAAEAPAAIAASLGAFQAQLQRQQAAGSRYIVGNSLTVLDVYFATSSIMLDLPGPEIMPRTKQNNGLLKMFAMNPPELQEILDSSSWLRDYRDYIYKMHLVTPAVLGGTPM